MTAIYKRRLREKRKESDALICVHICQQFNVALKQSLRTQGKFNVNEYNRLFHFINLLVSNDLKQKFVYLMQQHSVQVINLGIFNVIVFVHVHAFFAVGVKTMARAQSKVEKLQRKTCLVIVYCFAFVLYENLLPLYFHQHFNVDLIIAEKRLRGIVFFSIE